LATAMDKDMLTTMGIRMDIEAKESLTMMMISNGAE
jgi:hypothetical protein